MTSMASFAQGNLISPTEWEKLSILNPNISLQEYEQQIIDWAKNNNQEPSEVVKQVLDEIKQGEEEEQKYKAAQLSRSKKKGGNGEDKGRLPTALRAGDLFYTPSKTSGIAHGHSGIYVSSNEIVEAPGIGKLAHQTNIKNTSYPKEGTVKQMVKTDPARRQAAAEKQKHI